MQTIIMLYNLKEGVTLEDYKKFSRSADQPLVNSYKIVKECDVYYTIGPEKIWSIFEVIKVESWGEWQRISQEEIMKKHIKEWEKYADVSSFKVIYGKKI